MNKKLTLSVDDTVIFLAKKYAADQKQSLSEIVENYFRKLTSDRIEAESLLKSPLVDSLLGSVTVPDDFDYDREKRDYLERKYLK